MQARPDGGSDLGIAEERAGDDQKIVKFELAGLSSFLGFLEREPPEDGAETLDGCVCCLPLDLDEPVARLTDTGAQVHDVARPGGFLPLVRDPEARPLARTLVAECLEKVQLVGDGT